MHRLSASFVLACHGCSEDIAEHVLGGASLRPSRNKYDWLGPGIYFWEANPLRGLDWAKAQARRKREKLKKPVVIGAVIDLRNCLDLMTTAGVDQVRRAYGALSAMAKDIGQELPKNSGTNMLIRELDCAVIETLHQIRADEGLSAIDTVRSAFVEGREAFPGSGFQALTHIQICVCNPTCIRGVFRVPPADLT